jgi:hypothetical protein
MSSSASEFAEPIAVDVHVSADALTVMLADGRSISAPIEWYPRLQNGTAKERRRWELIGSGRGVHWPDLDEDISVEALLRGQRSNESRSSLQAWLATRGPNL